MLDYPHTWIFINFTTDPHLSVKNTSFFAWWVKYLQWIMTIQRNRTEFCFVLGKALQLSAPVAPPGMALIYLYLFLPFKHASDLTDSVLWGIPKTEMGTGQRTSSIWSALRTKKTCTRSQNICVQDLCKNAMLASQGEKRQIMALTGIVICNCTDFQSKISQDCI